MKTLRLLFPAALLLLGALTTNFLLPMPTAEAQVFGRVRARVSRSSGLWEITNSTGTMAVVRYRVAFRGTGDWRNHRAFVQSHSVRLLGYDANTYDFQIVDMTQNPY